MQKTCTNCGEHSASVPMIVAEAEAARHERNLRRIWIALIVAISMVFASNALWLWAWMQYDYMSTTTEEIILDGGDGGNANYIGQDGNIYNGKNNNPTNDNQNEKEENG